MPGTDLIQVARPRRELAPRIEQPRRRIYRIQVVYSKVIDPVVEPPVADQADLRPSCRARGGLICHLRAHAVRPALRFKVCHRATGSTR